MNNVTNVATRKYFLPSEETLDDLWGRVSAYVGQAEPEERRSFWSDQFFRLMAFHSFIPGGRILANAGTSCGQLESCFVIAGGDSLEHIFQGHFYTHAKIQSRGGGVGAQFGHMRPRDAQVMGGDRGEFAPGAAGPVMFLRMINFGSVTLNQDGGRRGANMAAMWCWHPDCWKPNLGRTLIPSPGIPEREWMCEADYYFVTCKARDPDAIRQYNISVCVTDELLQLAASDDHFAMYFVESVDEGILGKIDAGICDPDGRLVRQFEIPQQLLKNKPVLSLPGVVQVTLSEQTLRGIWSERKIQRYKNLGRLDCTYNVRIYRWVRAKEYMYALAEHCHINGDPGVIFIDHVNDVWPCPFEECDSCNPCGEQMLAHNEACNLGSMNLAAYVGYAPEDRTTPILDHERAPTAWKHIPERLRFKDVPKGAIKKQWLVPGIVAFFDLKRFQNDIKIAHRFLDDVITVNRWPTPETEAIALAHRRVGLGITNLGKCLVMLGTAYGSEDNYVLSRIFSTFSRTLNESNLALGKEKGEFPDAQRCGMSGRRNISVSCIAPNGSISMLLEDELGGATSGCESFYAFSYEKKTTDGSGAVYYYGAEIINWYLRVLGMAELTQPEMKLIKESEGTVERVERVMLAAGGRLGEILCSAHSLDPYEHVDVMRALAPHISNSISKTVNLRESATVEDILGVFHYAGQSPAIRCIALYRNNSRRDQILVTKKTNKVRIRKRPEKVSGDTYGVPCSLGEVLVTINADPDDSTKPFEILLQLGHAGSEPHAECEAVARLCSVMLRAGIEADEIIKQLEGIKADKPVVWKNHGIVHSLPDAVAKALRVFTEERSGSKIELPPTNDVCSICHGTNVRVQEGCSTCNDCGHSSCG